MNWPFELNKGCLAKTGAILPEAQRGARLLCHFCEINGQIMTITYPAMRAGRLASAAKRCKVPGLDLNRQ
jgi:hypothetical protein